MAKRTHRRSRSIRKRFTYKKKGGAILPPFEYETPGGEITVIMSADKRKPTMNALLQSLQRHGFSYKVIGIGKPWEGFHTKIENYVEGIKGVKTKYVMTLDAYDTLAIQSCARTLEAFQRRPRAHLPILFGAETYCYPHGCKYGIEKWHKLHRGEAGIKDEKHIQRIDGYKKTNKPFFLNSGCILGERDSLQAFMETVNSMEFEYDQIACMKVALTNIDSVDLDIEECIFRNKIDHLEKCPDEGTSDGPCVIHFPGQRDRKQQAKTLNLYSNYLE